MHWLKKVCISCIIILNDCVLFQTWVWCCRASRQRAAWPRVSLLCRQVSATALASPHLSPDRLHTHPIRCQVGRQSVLQSKKMVDASLRKHYLASFFIFSKNLFFSLQVPVLLLPQASTLPTTPTLPTTLPHSRYMCVHISCVCVCACRLVHQLKPLAFTFPGQWEIPFPQGVLARADQPCHMFGLSGQVNVIFLITPAQQKMRILYGAVVIAFETRSGFTVTLPHNFPHSAQL